MGMLHSAEHSRRRMGLREGAAALMLICIGIGTLPRTHLCTHQPRRQFVIPY